MSAQCPNCGGSLATSPTRKKKCPHCGNYIYVRQGQLVGEIQVEFRQAPTIPAKRPTSRPNPLLFAIVSFVVIASFIGVCILGQISRGNEAVRSVQQTAQAMPTKPTLTPMAKKPTPTRTPQPKPMPRAVPSATPTLTLVPVATTSRQSDPVTAQSPTLPFVRAEKDVNLRAGPGTNYDVIGGLSTGQSFNIVGRNADASWWQIKTDTGLAWVAASVVKAVNTDQDIEIVEAPPTPTSTLAPTVIIPTPTLVSLPTFTPAPFSPAPVAPSGGCCKICGPNSKACGDSCISNSKQCRKGPGCACEG